MINPYYSTAPLISIHFFPTESGVRLQKQIRMLLHGLAVLLFRSGSLRQEPQAAILSLHQACVVDCTPRGLDAPE